MQINGWGKKYLLAVIQLYNRSYMVFFHFVGWKKGKQRNSIYGSWGKLVHKPWSSKMRNRSKDSWINHLTTAVNLLSILFRHILGSVKPNSFFSWFYYTCFIHPIFRFWFLVTFGDVVTKTLCNLVLCKARCARQNKTN